MNEFCETDVDIEIICKTINVSTPKDQFAANTNVSGDGKDYQL